MSYRPPHKRDEAKAHPASTAVPTTAQLCEQAETLATRADRRGGSEAIGLLASAVATYDAALATTSISLDARLDALASRGETLEKWARLLLDTKRSLPDALSSSKDEEQLSRRVAALLLLALQSYACVVPTPADAPPIPLPLRQDAATGLANVCDTLAELDLCSVETLPNELYVRDVLLTSLLGHDASSSTISSSSSTTTDPMQAYYTAANAPARNLVPATASHLESLAQALSTTHAAPLTWLRIALAGYTIASAYQGGQDDCELATNRADVLISLGEAQCRYGDIQSASLSFRQGLQDYGLACSSCDSTRGDDLPSLLLNWGVAYDAIATCIPPTATTDALFVRLQLIDLAVSKLTAAAMFDRADPAPLNALGDVWSAAGDTVLLMRQGGHESAWSSLDALQAETTGLPNQRTATLVALVEAALADPRLFARTGDEAELEQSVLAALIPSASETPDVFASRLRLASHCYQQALARGYEAALRIDARQQDALVGVGEACVMLGRLARAMEAINAGCNSPLPPSHELFARGGASFRSALHHARLVPRLGCFSDRCQVVYNAACCCALAASSHASQNLMEQAQQWHAASAELLHRLHQVGASPRDEALRDEDLAGMLSSLPP